MSFHAVCDADSGVAALSLALSSPGALQQLVDSMDFYGDAGYDEESATDEVARCFAGMCSGKRQVLIRRGLGYDFARSLVTCVTAKRLGIKPGMMVGIVCALKSMHGGPIPLQTHEFAGLLDNQVVLRAIAEVKDQAKPAKKRGGGRVRDVAPDLAGISCSTH